MRVCVHVGLVLVVFMAMLFDHAEAQKQPCNNISPNERNTTKIPLISGCWKVMRKVKGCGAEIRTSFTRKRISLGPSCCKVIVGMTQHCFAKVFTKSPYGIFFGLAVKLYCSTIANRRHSPPQHYMHAGAT